MSWDSYIDNLIGHGGGHADKVCIIGTDGAKWTSDGHPKAIQITPTEAASVASAFKSSNCVSFAANGVHVEGVKYQFLREEENKLVLAKKKDHGALTLQASKTAIVIGHTKEGGQQGNTNKAVAVIADYLESLGM